MNKIQQQHYLNRKSLAKMELDFFFEVIFKRLGHELELLRNTLFDYRDENGNERKPTVYEEIFGLNEQAWVGVLNNAIIRAFPDTANTLLEFTVYNEGKDENTEIRSFYGRADLLVHLKNWKGKEINLLFEAKQNKENSSKKMLEESENNIEAIRKQAKEYYLADKNYFGERKNLFIVPITFGWIPAKEMLKTANDYINSSNNKQEDFCSLYYEGDSGIWVYGEIINTEEINLKHV